MIGYYNTVEEIKVAILSGIRKWKTIKVAGIYNKCSDGDMFDKALKELIDSHQVESDGNLIWV